MPSAVSRRATNALLGSIAVARWPAVKPQRRLSGLGSNTTPPMGSRHRASPPRRPRPLVPSTSPLFENARWSMKPATPGAPRATRSASSPVRREYHLAAASGLSARGHHRLTAPPELPDRTSSAGATAEMHATATADGRAFDETGSHADRTRATANARAYGRDDSFCASMYGAEHRGDGRRSARLRSSGARARLPRSAARPRSRPWPGRARAGCSSAAR